MEARDRRALIALLLLAVGVGVVGLMLRGGGSARATDAPLEITPEVRAAGLRFAPDVTERDRAWVLAAIASARPEARRLIDEVDGLVEVRVYANDPTALGRAHMDSHGLAISLDAHALNGDRAIERNAVVLHELGHIIDYVLVPDDLMQELDRSIPRGGACGPNRGSPAAPSPPSRPAASTGRRSPQSRPTSPTTRECSWRPRSSCASRGARWRCGRSRPCSMRPAWSARWRRCASATAAS